jgi:hypothetical protein
MSMQQRLRDEKWHQNKIEYSDITYYRNQWYKYIMVFDDGDMYEDYECYDYDAFDYGEVY